ncbi:MAG: M24 family metallopeptidase [Polaromonas sp.]
MDSIFQDERKRQFFNPAGKDVPLRSPISSDVVRRARAWRKSRLVKKVNEAECAAILLYDPINIRYALDVCHMQLWAAHNPFHYALVFADGYAIDFLFGGCGHLADNLETVQEIRNGTTWYYFFAGERLGERVDGWADEIAQLVRERGGGNMRLAVDKLEPLGVDALRKRGMTLVEGQKLTELARCIKSPEELELMGWTIRVAEAGMARMYENSVPGKSEQEIWAELHYENIRSGGEWIETRLLTAGQRTNPWYQEASDYVCQEGDMLSFDTDMIGPYGYCADLSRSWAIGHVPMNDGQKALYSVALEQIEHNLGLLRAGLSFEEFNAKSWRIPDRYVEGRYTVAVHGVGLADEYPAVLLHPDFANGYQGQFEENMVVSVESLIGEKGGRECVKLETQVVIGRDKATRLDTFPFERI